VYDPGEIHDEALASDGSPRPAYRALLAEVSADPLAVHRRSQELVREREIRFGKGDDEQDFVLDPIPRILDAGEWAELERGLGQRARALNALLADAYGERRIVAESVVPERVLLGAEYFEPEMDGLVGERPAAVIGFDLVRGQDGRLVVLEDNSRTPSGMAYAVAARGVSEALFPGAADQAMPLDPVFGWLAKAVREATPAGVTDPVCVLLTDGPVNSAWYEHVVVADRIGLSIVQLGDIEVRGDELWFRDAEASPRRADVVLRRTDADRIAGPGQGLTWVGECLYGPVRSGKLGMVNAFGSGLADDKLLYAYVPDAIRFYLGEEPLIGQIPTLDCAEESALERVISGPRELVMKPRSESGGVGVVVGSQATPNELAACVDLVTRSPNDYIAQEIVSLSTCPTVVGDAIEPRHVDLRAFAVSTSDGVRLMPGGLTRVALQRGSLVVNSSQGGGGKDTWVVG
jgi:uncharacterized circularly permuted ATP-grasp superfamily protein